MALEFESELLKNSAVMENVSILVLLLCFHEIYKKKCLFFSNLQAIEAKLAGIHSYTGVDWTMNEKGFFQSCVTSTRKVMFGMVTQAEEVIYFPNFLSIFYLIVECRN